MFTFDKTDLQRFAVSAVGAATLSAATLLGAAGPAKAAAITAPLTVAEWQDVMAHRIDSFREGSTPSQSSRLMSSDVAVQFTGDGDFAGATLARTSGDRTTDNRALKVARNLRYAALPAGFRGVPTTVRMTLYFGAGAEAEAEYNRLQARAARQIRMARTDQTIETAAK